MLTENEKSLSTSAPFKGTEDLRDNYQWTQAKDPPVWQRSGNDQWYQTESLPLQLSPTDKTGAQEATLIWTLLVAPAKKSKAQNR